MLTAEQINGYTHPTSERANHFLASLRTAPNQITNEIKEYLGISLPDDLIFALTNSMIYSVNAFTEINNGTFKYAPVPLSLKLIADLGQRSAEYQRLNHSNLAGVFLEGPGTLPTTTVPANLLPEIKALVAYAQFLNVNRPGYGESSIGWFDVGFYAMAGAMAVVTGGAILAEFMAPAAGAATVTAEAASTAGATAGTTAGATIGATSITAGTTAGATIGATSTTTAASGGFLSTVSGALTSGYTAITGTVASATKIIAPAKEAVSTAQEVISTGENMLSVINDRYPISPEYVSASQRSQASTVSMLPFVIIGAIVLYLIYRGK